MTNKMTAKKQQEVFDTKNVVRTLEGLMNKVTTTDCTPATVNAACNCADKITDILRLHLDVERLRCRMSPNPDNRPLISGNKK